MPSSGIKSCWSEATVGGLGCKLYSVYNPDTLKYRNYLLADQESKLKLKEIFAGQPQLAGTQAENSAPAIREIGTKAAVQRQPVIVKDSSAREFRLFVDVLTRLDGQIIILGWCTSPVMTMDLLAGSQRLVSTLTRHARGDVAEALSLPSGDMFGFCLIAEEASRAAALELAVHLPRAALFRSGPLAEKTGLSDAQRALVPKLLEGRVAALQRLPMGSADWWEALSDLPEASKVPSGFHGFVEGVFVSPAGNGVVFGWALHPEEAIVWLEDEMQNIHPLKSAFRRKRQDISEAFRSLSWCDMDSAFIAVLPEITHNPFIKLRAATEAGIVTLSERGGAEMLPANPRGAAENLFAIETEAEHYCARAALVDWPVLAPIIARHCTELDAITPETRIFGTLPGAPEVSVIVPLYKRFDFMEHQILEFIRDPYFRERVELIYVIDDPNIQSATLAEANKLFQLYDFPFKVVSGLQNRGFSGANNLGAQYASGKALLFLNSDVIPQGPGWLEKMLAVLEDETVGAVGAQLLFPGGGIQHIGMDFEYLPEFRIWSNQHPGAGMPARDPASPAFDVPAATGACLLIRSAVFAQIKGWDTGYLLGDFEDSHFCFAIRAAGYRIMCQPAATLTHLERQSFTGIGGDAFRIRMTICNAVRHQALWKDYLEQDPMISEPAQAPQQDATDA